MRRPGSSPLARGLHELRRRKNNEIRIIPARAGFTCRARRCGRGTPDHPRSRGVYRQQYRAYACSPGSSPLARGLHPGSHLREPQRGIIPARAGFTPRRTGGRRRPPDHPRSRGVYWSTMTAPARAAGSSPLARGLRVHRGDVQQGDRIIPARAGFTPGEGPRPTWRRDHPRSRGVYRRWNASQEARRGSSPLARGLRPIGEGDLLLTRIIPARAGFTRLSACLRWTGQDHPRSRGVYDLGRRDPPRDLGSSPLARGLPPDYGP